VLGEADDAAHDFSSEVQCASGQQIIVERSMYFDYKEIWTGGSDVVGATVAGHHLVISQKDPRGPIFDTLFWLDRDPEKHCS